jgi:Na+/alanine symporter
LANISVAASALPNLIALLFLSGVFVTLMKDYLSGDNKYATRIIDRNRQYVRIAEQK